MKPRIKLAYADFWGGFDPQDNYFSRLLSTRYEIELADEPDLLIYSCFGKAHRRYRCPKVYYTGENTRPNFRECDYAFTFDYVDRPQHYRLPLYVMYARPGELVKGPVDAERILAAKTGFCNFVYSNPRCKTRNRFFAKLSKYKRVDSGGRLLNNIGGPVADKLAFLKSYKFTIAFENDSHPGYTTEKIVEPMLAWSAPIYWGNPLVDRDFNPRSFVNYFDHGNLDDLVDRVVELDRNDDLYCDMLRQPWFHGNLVPPPLQPESVLAQFAMVFAQPAAARRQSLWSLPWRGAAACSQRSAA